MAGDGSNLTTYTQPNVYGRYFKCSKRTAAHLDSTKAALARKAKKDNKSYSLRIIQGCYNTSVPASAGTHDKDSCLDVEIVGMDWQEAQTFLRKQGWAAFWRKPPLFGNHIHMVSLPPFKFEFVAPVGSLVPGQVSDYYDHKSGLSGHLADPTWHPDPIKPTIFDYAAWVEAEALREKVAEISKRKAAARRKIQDLKELIKRLSGRTADLEARVKELS
jgi:hypothetical protein